MMLKGSTKWKVTAYTKTLTLSKIVEAADRSEALPRGKASIKRILKYVKVEKWTSQRVY
jgi:hypothetical protein